MGIKIKLSIHKNKNSNKMKVTLAIIAASAEAGRVARQAGIDNDRRYFQLADMMTHYNPSFDERKYWTYGCNCLILGDRPMSDPGHGKPVDALDTVCKAYKDCLKCARMTYGDQCIGEFVKYKYGLRKDEIVCRDGPNSCERALCECDAMFAQQHVAAKDVFDTKYHMFWAQQDGHPYWDPTEAGQCETSGGPTEPECCRAETKDTPFRLYN